MTTIDQTEMMKLAYGLRDRGIKFSIENLYDGIQIVVGDGDWDAICHSGSYGHEKGLIEVMGLPQCQDDVIGWLTAEEVLKMVDELRPMPEPEVIDYENYEPKNAPVKMKMTKTLANNLMDSLTALDISANGRIPETEEELQSCEIYAKRTFFRLCEEWEQAIGGTWEFIPD